MTRTTVWQCDVCEKRFNNRDAVENGVVISFRKNDDTYLEVCGHCIKKIVETVNGLKPKIND